MRILLVITSLGVGGAERLVTGLADRLVAQGHEVVLARLHGKAQLLPHDPRVKLINLHMRRSPLGVIAGMSRFRKLILSFCPDVVNSHLVHANILSRLLRVVVPMNRLVTSAHNTNEGGRLRMLSYRLTDWLANISTNVSEEAVNSFEQKSACPFGRMIVVHNGIDTDAFTVDSVSGLRIREEMGIESSAPLLLAVGRLCEQKDYPNLLRAFATLDTLDSHPRLVIVGDGPMREKLASLAQSLDIAEKVFFLGIRHDVAALMAACDLFVLSSAREGFGLVVAEAMACGRVPIATDCGGVREVVGNVGFLVPPSDSKALAVALERALSLSFEERESLGQAGRARVVDHFSLDTTARRYLSIYQDSQPY